MFRTLAGPRSELVLFRNSFSFGTPLELLWIQITGKAEAAKSASDASVPSLQRPNETLTQQSRSPRDRSYLAGGQALKRHTEIHTAESRDASRHDAGAMLVVTPRTPGGGREEVMNEGILIINQGPPGRTGVPRRSRRTQLPALISHVTGPRACNEVMPCANQCVTQRCVCGDRTPGVSQRSARWGPWRSDVP